MVLVKIEFVGTLRGAVGKKNYEITLDEPATVGRLLQQLNAILKLNKEILIREESSDPSSDILILVDGKEISVLESLATKLTDGSLVALVPVSHGG